MKILIITIVLIAILFAFIGYCCVSVSSRQSRKEEHNNFFDEV